MEFSSTISLELQAVENLNLKLKLRTREGPISILRIVSALQKHLKGEKSKSKNLDNMLRAKQIIMLNRLEEMYSQFSEEIERTIFGIHDGRASVIKFHWVKQLCSSLLLVYVQQLERSLATQKNKLILRLTGFSKSIIDDVYEKKGNLLHNTFNSLIYKLQHATKVLIAAHIWPKHGFLSNSISHIHEPIVLFNILRFVEAASESIKTNASKDDLEQLNHLYTNIRSCIVVSFNFTRDRAMSIRIIVFILIQAVRTLKAILLVRVRFGSAFDTFIVSAPAPMPKDSTRKLIRNAKVSVDKTAPKEFLGWDWSGSCTYTDRNLCEDITFWLQCITYLTDKKNPPSGYMFNDSLAGELSLYLSSGSPFLTDLLYCASTIHFLFMKEQSATASTQSSIKGLLLSSLQVSLRSVERYAAMLGPFDSVVTMAMGDVSYLKATDDECIAALNCASVSFGSSLCVDDLSSFAVGVLTAGTAVCTHRLHSFFVVSAWMKCVLSAALFCVNIHTAHLSSSNSLYKDVTHTLAGYTVTVMSYMSLYRHSLSLLHSGMLIIRLLTRDMFQRRNSTELLCERSLLAYTKPLTEYSASVANEEDLKADEEFARLATNTGPSSPSAALVNNSAEEESSVSAVQQWKKDHLLNTLYNGVIPQQTDFKFAELLFFIGETHIQSLEVVEQLLLLIDHLSAQSQLCKFLIIDTGMPMLLQRILTMHSSSSVYIVALTGLCIDLLDV